MWFCDFARDEPSVHAHAGVAKPARIRAKQGHRGSAAVSSSAPSLVSVHTCTQTAQRSEHNDKNDGTTPAGISTLSLPGIIATLATPPPHPAGAPCTPINISDNKPSVCEMSQSTDTCWEQRVACWYKNGSGCSKIAPIHKPLTAHHEVNDTHTGAAHLRPNCGRRRLPHRRARCVSISCCMSVLSRVFCCLTPLRFWMNAYRFAQRASAFSGCCLSWSVSSINLGETKPLAAVSAYCK